MLVAGAAFPFPTILPPLTDDWLLVGERPVWPCAMRLGEVEGEAPVAGDRLLGGENACGRLGALVW